MGGGRAGAVLRMRTHRLENALELLLRQVVEEQGHARLDVLHERPRLLGQAKQAIPHALVVGVSAARRESKEVRGGQVMCGRCGVYRRVGRFGWRRNDWASPSQRSDRTKNVHVERARVDPASLQPERARELAYFCWPAGSPSPGDARSPADEDNTAEFVVAARGHAHVFARRAPVELVEDLGRRLVPRHLYSRQHTQPPTRWFSF